MRIFLSVLTSGLILALGTAASLLQSQNHELAAHLDDRHRKLELTYMFILDAEASILAAETNSSVLRPLVGEPLAAVVEGVQ